MSDDELTDVVANMDDYVLKSCLEHLSESDLADILERTDNLSDTVKVITLTDIESDKKTDVMSFKSTSALYDNRYDYLFSDSFSDYVVAKELNGTISSDFAGAFPEYKLKYSGKSVTIQINATGKSYQVILTSSDSSVLKVSNATIGSAKVDEICIDTIQEKKTRHHYIDHDATNKDADGFSVNPNDGIEKNNCDSTWGAVGVVCNYLSGKPSLTLVEKDGTKTKKQTGSTTHNSTSCSDVGYTKTTYKYICSHCDKGWSADAESNKTTETTYNGYAAHTFPTSYNYSDNNYHYIRCNNYDNCSLVNPSGAIAAKYNHTNWIYADTADGSHHTATCGVCKHLMVNSDGSAMLYDHFPNSDGSGNVVWHSGSSVGLDSDKHYAECAFCHAYYSGFGHSMTTSKDSSCETKGDAICTYCGYVILKYVSAKGHTNDNFSWETSTLSGTGVKFPSTYSSGTPSVETGDYTLSDGNKVHVSTDAADTGLGVTVPNGQRFVQCTRSNCDDATNHHPTAYQYAVIPAVASSPIANKAISSVSTAVYGSQGGKVNVTATLKKGYHLTGWYYDSNCQDEAVVTAAGEVTIGSNPIQLYANGEVNKNKVKVVIPTPGSSTVTWEQPADTSTTTWSTLDGVPCCEGEYQKSVSFPTPTAVGYVFAGWDVTGTGAGTASYTTTGITTYSFGTGDDTVAIMTATWKPRTDTKLSIDVYTQDLNYQWDVYTKVDTLIYTGTTDSVVNTSDLITYAFKKENLSSDYYKYLRNNKGDTVTIGADGRTRIEIYYARIKHTVKINGAPSKLKADISLSSQTKQTVPSSSSGDVTTWTVYAGDTCIVTITPYTSERERYDHYIERVKRIESVNGAAVSYSLTGEDLAPYVQDDGAFVYQMSDIIKDMQFDYEIYGRPEIRISSRLSSNAKASPWTADVMYTVTGTTNLGKKVTYLRIISGETDTALTVDPGVYLIYAETAYRWNITTDAGTAVELDVSDGAEVSDAGGHKDAVFDVDVKNWSKFSDSATYILDLK